MFSRFSRQASWLLALALAAAPMYAVAAAEVDKHALYAEAVDLLDRWRGDRSDLDEAHERLTTVLLDAPDFTPAHVEMARWYLMNSRNNELALRSLERAQALEPDLAGIYVLRGYVYQKMGRLKESLSELDRAEEIGTDNPWLLLNRGFTLQKLGREEEARVLFETVFESSLDDPKAWPAARQSLVSSHTNAGDRAGAEQVYVRAIALQPTDMNQRVEYVEWLLSGERVEEALANARELQGAETEGRAREVLLMALAARAVSLLATDATAAATVYEEMRAMVSESGFGEMPTYAEWARVMQASQSGAR